MPVKNILVRKIAQCREKGECRVVGWTKSQLRQVWLNSSYYAVKNGHGKCTAFAKGSMKLQGKQSVQSGSVDSKKVSLLLVIC